MDDTSQKIIDATMSLIRVTPELFQNVQWELEQDLQMFMTAYMDKITPDFVNLSIGMRAPQLYEETAPLIMKVPQAFISSLTEYFIHF